MESKELLLRTERKTGENHTFLSHLYIFVSYAIIQTYPLKPFLHPLHLFLFLTERAVKRLPDSFHPYLHHAVLKALNLIYVEI